MIEENLTIVKQLCDICSKPVIWGRDGCPVVEQGSEISILFCSPGIWRHYDCAGQEILKTND